MSLELSESEMLNRYVDGLKKSASAANEITRSLFESKPKIFVTFIDGLKVAAGSAHQLAHAQQNLQWLGIRDLLEAVIDKSQTIVIFNHSANPFWLSIENSLKNLIEKGKKMATSKAVSRADLLVDLAVREASVKKQLETEVNTNG